jgi:hypothetical protein
MRHIISLSQRIKTIHTLLIAIEHTLTHWPLVEGSVPISQAVNGCHAESDSSGGAQTGSVVYEEFTQGITPFP